MNVHKWGKADAQGVPVKETSDFQTWTCQQHVCLPCSPSQLPAVVVQAVPGQPE